jgi:hypothetical protein
MRDRPPRLLVVLALGAVIYCAGVFYAVHRYNSVRLENADYLRITGGGFIYNYRIADMRGGITVAVRKPFPANTQLLAEFENPAGGGLRFSKDIVPGKRGYVFDTGSLSGVEADREYQVVLRLMDMQNGEELERQEKRLKSGVAPRTMPDRPLTIGPGYHPNPDLKSGSGS